MVAVLVILDGASEPPRAGAPTSLELARTPALDRLATAGALERLRTVAPGLSPGSEAAIPALLGWLPTGPVDRGALEAAALGIEVAQGQRAWRVDVRAASPGARGRADRSAAAAAAGALRAAAPRHAVHRLAGDRLLLVGPAPLPAAARATGLRVWPEGIVPPRVLGPETVLVGASGAAIGAARLMGADTVVPDGATGCARSDLAAKARAAVRAIAEGAAWVVVHVGGPDEASHRRDRAAKVASIEHADSAVVAPLAAAVQRAGGTLTVTPDHGCDPATGAHDALAVPCLRWTAGDAGGTTRRLTERAVAHLPESPLAALAVA